MIGMAAIKCMKSHKIRRWAFSKRLSLRRRVSAGEAAPALELLGAVLGTGSNPHGARSPRPTALPVLFTAVSAGTRTLPST